MPLLQAIIVALQKIMGDYNIVIKCHYYYSHSAYDATIMGDYNRFE